MTRHQKKLSSAIAIACSLAFGAGCSTSRTLVVLLPQENGGPAAVTVTANDHVTVIEDPLTAIRVDGHGQVERLQFTAAEVDREFGDAIAALPARTVRFTLYFNFQTTELTAASKTALDDLFREIGTRADVDLRIIGHTDRVGTVERNRQLSLDRAAVVRDLLLKRGLKVRAIAVEGRGESEPVVPTADNVPEPRNRRAEILLR